MSFMTMNLLDKIRRFANDLEKDPLPYRLLGRIILKRSTKLVLKEIDNYLKTTPIDAEHMVDIIHTLNVFSYMGIISEDERRQIYMFTIDERDSLSSIRYLKTVDGLFPDQVVVNIGKIDATIDDIPMVITDTIYKDSKNVNEITTVDKFIDNEYHDFYNTAGRAYLYGIKKYLQPQPHTKKMIRRKK